MTIDVKDAGGNTVALQTPNANGRAAAAASRPVALSTEDLAKLAEISTKLDGPLNVQSGAPGSAVATIAQNASLSDLIDLADKRIHRLHIPAAGWDAAVITFQVSYDGVALANLYDQNGEVTIATAGAGRSIVLDQSIFYGVRWVKIRSGSAANPVNQTAARTLTLVTVAR